MSISPESPSPEFPAPDSTGSVKSVLASEFVSTDTDRPKADENNVLPAPETQSQQTEKGKPGRKPSPHPTAAQLRDRERYARKMAERRPPPSFSDLPGGPQPSEKPPPPPGKPPVNYALNAGAGFDLVTGLLANAVGPEWEPRSETERMTVVNPLARYMEYKKWDDLSPGWALAMAVFIYSMPRSEKLIKAIKGKFVEKAPERGKLQTTPKVQPSPNDVILS